MNIYSTRHGQTDYNKAEMILGTTDVPLNSTGIRQAERLAEEVERIGDIDVIIVSPMLRAQTTAKAAAEKCGIRIVTENRFREWDYGTYEGQSRFTEGFPESKHEFGVRMGGSGESLLQLAHRVYSALDDIIRDYSGRNVLIVSHGGICRIIETYFNDMSTAEFDGWFMDNCQIIRYTL